MSMHTLAEKSPGAREILTRDSPFSYVCGQCNRCCVNKIIKLNPYEVARLATNRGISTTEFIRTYTMAHGTVLNMTPKGECVFRSEQGCRVHPDRPLVCRLYPLGRHVSASGEERFSVLPPHPQSEGTFSRSGTVAAYLHAQGAAPYIASIDTYLALLGRLLAALQRSERVSSRATRPRSARSVKKDPGAQAGLEMLDMDLVVSEYCARESTLPPGDPDDKMAVHIRALESMLKTLEKGG